MNEQNPLQTELEYFQRHKQEYLKLYKNQFVLIKGEEFAGAFTTEAEAYKAGLERFGNKPFLKSVQHLSPEQVQYVKGYTDALENVVMR